jgi:hypothetical protein
MSNITTEINGFFRPYFYTPANGEKATSENIRKAYHAQDPKPSTLKTVSPAVYTGLGVTVLGLIGSMFGFTKENSGAKWFGGILALIGLGLAGVGKFTYGVDLSATESTPVVKPVEVTPPPMLPIEQERELIRTQEEEIEALKDSFNKTKDSNTFDKLVSITQDKQAHPITRFNAINALASFVEAEDATTDVIKKVTSKLFHLSRELIYADKENFSSHLSYSKLSNPVSGVFNLNTVLRRIDARIQYLNKDIPNDYKDLVSELIPFLKDDSIGVRGLTSDVLKALRSPEAIEPLFECIRQETLKDSSSSVPWLIDEIIKTIDQSVSYSKHSPEDKQKIIAIMDRYSTDENETIRLYAQETKEILKEKTKPN